MAGIRTDTETTLIKQAVETAEELNKQTTKAAKSKTTTPKKPSSPLKRKLKKGEPKEVYLALCEDIADRMSDTVSGRDYSSMSKSFLDSYSRYIEELEKEDDSKNDVPSAIATLQIQLQQRSRKAVGDKNDEENG